MTMTGPVQSWAEDYDIFDPGYVRQPFPVWDELREGRDPRRGASCGPRTVRG